MKPATIPARTETHTLAEGDALNVGGCVVVNDGPGKARLSVTAPVETSIRRERRLAGKSSPRV